MACRSWGVMDLAPVGVLLVCLVGSLQGQPFQRVHFSSCQNGDFEIRCSNLNDSIVVRSGMHSVADLWHCRNCDAGCMGDQTYGRFSFHSDYGWTLGSLCNGRNLCRLEKWCGSDCVETFNATYFCVGLKENLPDMTGQLPTPPSGTPDGDNKQDEALGSVAGGELHRAHVSTCKNQSFAIGCSDNSSIVILSVAHSVADPWNCPNCNSTCMGGQSYSHNSYYSHRTYQSRHGYHSQSHTYHSHHHTYHSRHQTPYSPGAVGRVSALCNGYPQCSIDKLCGSHCMEAYNITYYCLNSTNIGTTCWKPGSPDYVVLRQCPVRINPVLRSGGSPTTQVTLTILTPYQNHFTVCRWSDRTCRKVTTRSTTLTGGFSLLPAGQEPLILQLNYHTKEVSTSSPMSIPASGASTTASAVDGAQKNPGDSASTTASAVGGAQKNPGDKPSTSSPMSIPASGASTVASAVGGAQQNPGDIPVLSATSTNGINTGQQNPAEGVRASATNGGLTIVDIIGIVAAMVVLLVLIIVVAILVTYYKGHCLPSTNANLKRKPVLDNVYTTGSEMSSSTGTTDTDWITIEEAYNQRYRNPGSLQYPPLPPRHY